MRHLSRAILFSGVLVLAGVVSAEMLTEAQLTRIVKDVKLLPLQAAPRSAALNDRISHGTGVRTGFESRAELTFKDLTITRLGENTIFSFNEGTRNLDLGGGAILVHVPKDSGGAKITTAAISAGISGTTVLLEVHKNQNSKAIVLEGVMRVGLADNPSDYVDLHAGEILVVPPHAKKMPKPQIVRLKTLVATSPLVTEFDPLPSMPLIQEEIDRQEGLVGPEQNQEEPPLDTLDQRFNAITFAASDTLANKFGPIKTITNPNPYIITTGTVIKTDPTIKTDGQKDFGKIYRGPATDGTASEYFFGSTVEQDTAFNSIGETGSTAGGVAAFKFSSLRIDGNPTISLGKGGPAALALISEGAITTGGGGTAVTFSSLKFVTLATQDGSISLGGGLAFSNIPELFLYARGGGNLTVGSPMANISQLTLNAGNNVQINGNLDIGTLRSDATNFLAGGGLVTVHTFLGLSASNDIAFAMKNWMFDGVTMPAINLTALNNLTIDNSTGQDAFANAGSLAFDANTITFTGSTQVAFSTAEAVFTAGSGGVQAGTTAFFHPGKDLSIFSLGSISAKSIDGGNNIQSSNDITTTGDLTAKTVNATGDITVGGNLTSSALVKSGSNVNVVNGTILANDIEAIGDIDGATVRALTINSGVSSPTGTLSAGSGGIRPFSLATPGTVHTFHIGTVESHTAAVGLDFSGNQFSAAGSDGGILDLFTDTQTFSAASGINAANFDGKNAPGLGETPGNGGTFSLTSNQGISLNGGLVTATTGIIDSTAGTLPAGTGGIVNFTSNGQISVANNSVIQVSSADPAGVSNRRSSNAGGTINLQSNLGTGVAINITNSSQLLSILSSTATGPGGKIILHATGTGATINANGTLRADKGAIDIRADGADGGVSVAGANLRADVIKVAALGLNGAVNIGANNTINAGTLITLYSEGSNGTLNFTADVTLNSAKTLLVAKTINIVGASTIVTVNSPVSQVFTDNANYQGSGGTGNATTGSMVGAANPQPFANRPPLGGVGGP